MFYVLRGGIPWRLLPSDLPPNSTVFRWFSVWRDIGVFETINHLPVMAYRERVGREVSSTAAVLDSPSVKTTESGGPRGYDEGKKVTGRKRQVMVGTDARGLILELQPTDVQDRDGPVWCCACLGTCFALLSKHSSTAAMPGRFLLRLPQSHGYTQKAT